MIDAANKMMPAKSMRCCSRPSLHLNSPLWLAGLVLAASVSAETCDVPFQLSKTGHVSVAVYDAQGRMFRELARGVTMPPGEHRLSWDGLDRYGQAAPPGKYEWRLLNTPGFTREFLVGVGTNPGWTPFDLWPGNHSGPTTLLADSTNLYVGASWSEGPPHLIRMSADGRRKDWSSTCWRLPNGMTGLARVGDVLYILYGQGMVRVVSPEVGEDFYARDPRLKDWPTWLPVDLFHPGDPEADKKPEVRGRFAPMSLAGGKDFLAVTVKDHNEIKFLWPQKGKISRSKTVPVPNPKGCAVAPDGRVFVVSGDAIVRVDPESGAIQGVVSDPELVSPTRMAYDAANDDLLVIQHGEKSDDVRRYHAADGKLIAVYGRPAGRAYGVFNPLDWGGLQDITADGQGGFFTAEDTPRRVAHFRGRARLELVQQWFGGTPWGCMCALDPDDPTLVYLFPDQKLCARGKIDYATRSWTLTELYDLPDGFSWRKSETNFHRDLFPAFGGGSYWEVRHKDGATFLVSNAQPQDGGPAVVRVDEREHRLLPVATLRGYHKKMDPKDPGDQWLFDLARAGAFTPQAGEYAHFALSWSDTNRNGKVDRAEIKASSDAGINCFSGSFFVDPQWNVYYPQPGPSAWVVITNEGSADLPVWDWKHAQYGNGIYPDSEKRLGATGTCGIFHNALGETYTVCNRGVNSVEPDVPPLTWPNNFTGISRFQKWNASGLLEWSVGVHTASKDRPAGEFSQVRCILGEARNCLVVLDACEPAAVWTRDGLYAGSLYGQRIADGLPDVAYNSIYWDDNHWGALTEDKRGEVLWGGMSHNSTPIYRIHGWDNWERQRGPIVIKQPTATARWQGTGLRAEYFANPNLEGSPKISKIDARVWFGAMGGAFLYTRDSKVWPDKSETEALATNRFSVCWKGFVEAPLGEKFRFVIYTYGRDDGTKITGNKVRLWVDGQLAIDQWEHVENKQHDPGWGATRACISKPIAMTAGRLAPIRLEYAATAGVAAQVHLFMSSECWDQRHVPQALLYPDQN